MSPGHGCLMWVKQKNQVRTDEGQEIAQKEYCSGNKLHVSLNAESGLVTNLVVTSGEMYDGQ